MWISSWNYLHNVTDETARAMHEGRWEVAIVKSWKVNLQTWGSKPYMHALLDGARYFSTHVITLTEIYYFLIQIRCWESLSWYYGRLKSDWLFRVRLFGCEKGPKSIELPLHLLQPTTRLIHTPSVLLAANNRTDSKSKCTRTLPPLLKMTKTSFKEQSFTWGVSMLFSASLPGLLRETKNLKWVKPHPSNFSSTSWVMLICSCFEWRIMVHEETPWAFWTGSEWGNMYLIPIT